MAPVQILDKHTTTNDYNVIIQLVNQSQHSDINMPQKNKHFALITFNTQHNNNNDRLTAFDPGQPG